MTTNSIQRAYFGDESGSDGRILCDTDLNAISNNAKRYAWEVPGYADILAFDQISQTADIDYGLVFSGETISGVGRSGGVFTKGGGLKPYKAAVLTTSIRAGMLGIWNQAAGSIAPPSASGVANMCWVHISGNPTVVHDDCATGYKRWDLVVCTIAEVDASTVLRDWMDGTTGAYTSQSVVPAKLLEVTFSVKKGTAATGGGESMPALDAGTHLLYAVRIDGDEGGADVAEIEEFYDYTIPYGRLRKVLQPAASAYNNGGWDIDTGGLGTMTSQSSSGVFRRLTFVPPEGSGEARVLGVRVAYLLESGYDVSIGKLDQGAPAYTERISTLLTCDGTYHETLVDLRGLLAGAEVAPVWGQGETYKGEMGDLSGVAMHFKSPTNDAGGNYVRAVEWYLVG